MELLDTGEGLTRYFDAAEGPFLVTVSDEVSPLPHILFALEEQVTEAPSTVTSTVYAPGFHGADPQPR